MPLKQLFLCVVTAFVMMPESGALHLEQKRNIKFSAQLVDEKVLKSANNPYSVRMILANEGSKPLTFLKWGSPFEEEISSRIIFSEPKTSSYLGKVAKRKSESFPERALATVEPGTELSVTVDINQLMAFHEKGKYEILATFPLVMFDTDASRHEKLTKANSTSQKMVTKIHIEVEGVRTKEDVQELFSKFHHPGECDPFEAKIVHDAAITAVSMVTDAADRIGSSADPTMFEQWLGDNNECPLFDVEMHDAYMHMYDTVFAVYELTSTHNYHPGGMILDCPTCLTYYNYNYTYAYVYGSDDTHRVHICGAFWSAPTRSHHRDSQPGTVIHEISHFDDQMDTEDHEYGTSSIQYLAQTDACTARDNADNIEAYAENVDCWAGHWSC